MNSLYPSAGSLFFDQHQLLPQFFLSIIANDLGEKILLTVSASSLSSHLPPSASWLYPASSTAPSPAVPNTSLMGTLWIFYPALLCSKGPADLSSPLKYTLLLTALAKTFCDPRCLTLFLPIPAQLRTVSTCCPQFTPSVQRWLSNSLLQGVLQARPLRSHTGKIQIWGFSSFLECLSLSLSLSHFSVSLSHINCYCCPDPPLSPAPGPSTSLPVSH
jgi:hypothetical protein